jgi:small subunit ribosomal protein S20
LTYWRNFRNLRPYRPGGAKTKFKICFDRQNIPRRAKKQGDPGMPNIKSAEKRMRTSEKARRRNKAIRSAISTARRRFLEQLAAKEREKTNAAYRQYCSILDKAAKKGVIKKEKAVRRKRRAAAQIARIA